MAYKKILVPLDGSEISEKAIEHAEHICKCDTVDSFILLRVYEPVLIDVRDYIETERASELQSKKEEEAKNYLEDIGKKLKNKGIPVKTILEYGMDPATKILEVAKKENVDIIVMCSHGKSKVLHWMFGSVANRVLMRTPIPVLVVVPEGRESND